MNDFKNQLGGLLATLEKLPHSDKQAALELLQLMLKDKAENISNVNVEESSSLSEKASSKTVEQKPYEESQVSSNIIQPGQYEEFHNIHTDYHHESHCVPLEGHNDNNGHYNSLSQQEAIQTSQKLSVPVLQEKFSMDILHHFSDTKCLERTDTDVMVTEERKKLLLQKEPNTRKGEELQLVAENLRINDNPQKVEITLGSTLDAHLQALNYKENSCSLRKKFDESSVYGGEQSLCTSKSKRTQEFVNNITMERNLYNAPNLLPEDTVKNYSEHSHNLSKYEPLLDNPEDKGDRNGNEAVPLLPHGDDDHLALIAAQDLNHTGTGATELDRFHPNDRCKVEPVEESNNSQACEGSEPLLTDDAQLRMANAKQERNTSKLEINHKNMIFDESSSSSFNLTPFAHISDRDSLYTEETQDLLPYLERENCEKPEYKEHSSKRNYQGYSENSHAMSYPNMKYSEYCRESKELFVGYDNDKSPVDLSSGSNIHNSKTNDGMPTLHDTHSCYQRSKLKSALPEPTLYTNEGESIPNIKKQRQSEGRKFCKNIVRLRLNKQLPVNTNSDTATDVEGAKMCNEDSLADNIPDTSNIEFEETPNTSKHTTISTESFELGDKINQNKGKAESTCLDSTKEFELGDKINQSQVREAGSKQVDGSDGVGVCEMEVGGKLRPVSCRTCRRQLTDVSHFPVHQRQCDPHLSCTLCQATFVHKVTYTRHLEGHKRNICSKCSQSFCSHKKLKAHMKAEHNYDLISQLYPCQHCTRKFLKRSSLYHHLKGHATPTQIVCQKCGTFCKDLENFDLHMADHIKSTKFRCNICPATFQRRQQFDDHLKHHKKNECELCGQPFFIKRDLVRHCRREHPGVPHNIPPDPQYKCDKCSRVFNRPSLLQHHLQLHSGVKLECAVCDKQFSHKRGLRKHIKSLDHKHMLQTNNLEKDHAYNVKQQMEYVCEYCGAQLPSKNMLSKHSCLNHKVGITWSCPHCDYKTKRNHTLKRHMELHKESRNFMCEICGSFFQALATLKDHYNFVHSEERNYKCKECCKTFKNNSSLARHLRIHSDDRPYQCQCGTSYKRLSHLKRHMSSAHNEILKSRAVKKFKRNDGTELSADRSFSEQGQAHNAEYSDSEEYEFVPVSTSSLPQVMPTDAAVKETSDILLQGQESIILMGENSNSGQGHIITIGDSQIIQLIPSTFFTQDSSFQSVSLVSANELHTLPMPSSSSLGEGSNSGQVVVEPFSLPQGSEAMVMVPTSQEDQTHTGEPDVMRTTLRTIEADSVTPGRIFRDTSKQKIKQDVNIHAIQNQEELGSVHRELSSVHTELSAHNLDTYNYSGTSSSSSPSLLPTLPPPRYITHNHTITTPTPPNLNQDMLQPSIICSDFVLPVHTNR